MLTARMAQQEMHPPSCNRKRGWVSQLSLVVFGATIVWSIPAVDSFLARPFFHNGYTNDANVGGRVNFQHFQPATILYQTTSCDSWLPVELLEHSTHSDQESWREQVEAQSLELIAQLIRDKLQSIAENATDDQETRPIPSLVHGKFVDLCCTVEGEKNLENIFRHESVPGTDQAVILGAVACLHSLVVTALCYGLSGTPEQFDRWVSHMAEPGDDEESKKDYSHWTADSTRRLKFRSDKTAGTKLLAELKWKQSAQGAFDLLVVLGAWSKHEDLALLRSGFPIRFGEAYAKASRESFYSPTHDPDALLGIRKDLRTMKIYTIDSASTSEIDDGLSCETYIGEDGSERQRYWIHIADADYAAPRGSPSFLGARKRATSHYLPQQSLCMFPPELSDAMSLTAQKDSMALSLGVEIADDGSIVDSSIIVTPSLVCVSYRLTYDDVDEMLADGIGYREEWQLGALYAAAVKRREYRIRNGSAEGFVPKQIPQTTISVFRDWKEPDGIGISMKIDVSHNGGVNQSSTVGDVAPESLEFPVSSASVLVTEMMIVAGEAIGKWKLFVEKQMQEARNNGSFFRGHNNTLRLAFRSQPKPDFRSRSREKRIMDDLLANNIGDGYCHSWYARRFLSPVEVSDIPKPHAGLGLECYCQWSSPIRRFGDLQVHCAIKRFLRRQAVLEKVESGEYLPSGITALDLGLDTLSEPSSWTTLMEQWIACPSLDSDIDYSDRAGWLRAAKAMQKSSQRYWTLEYIRRMKENEPEKSLQVVVLGCTNPTRRQYALYIYDLGLEWRYISPGTSLQAGMKFKVQVGNVFPRLGQLSLVRVEL